jgi:hypothetical protein
VSEWISTPTVESDEKFSTPSVSDDDALLTSHGTPDNHMTTYRQYVKDAILCDISDEQLVEKLSASDQGMEEAMKRNGDRVFLWQFKRMRFETNIASFAETSISFDDADPPVQTQNVDVEMIPGEILPNDIPDDVEYQVDNE